MGMTAQGHTLHGMMPLLRQMDSNEQLQLIIFHPQHSVPMVPQLEIKTRAPTHTRWQGVKNRRPTTISTAPHPNGMYPSSRPYTQYRSSIKTGLPYGDLQEYWL